MVVDEATKLLTSLNLALHSRHGSRHHLAIPQLVENIEELLNEPPEPEWPEEDADEMALLDLVHTSPLQLCYGYSSCHRLDQMTMMMTLPQ